MAKSIRDFGKNPENMTTEEKADFERLSEKAKKFENMNENQLINQLMKNVEDKKRSGTFNPKELESFYASVSPMLTESQRQKLSVLIKQIK